MLHICNTITLGGESRRIESSRTPWDILWVLSQPGQHETLSQRRKREKKKKRMGRGKEKGRRKGKVGKGKKEKGKGGKWREGKWGFRFLGNNWVSLRQKEMHQNPLSKDYSWDCKNGSAGKNSSCSSRRLDFDSQPPHQVAPSHLRLQP